MDADVSRAGSVSAVRSSMSLFPLASSILHARRTVALPHVQRRVCAARGTVPRLVVAVGQRTLVGPSWPRQTIAVIRRATSSSGALASITCA
jgi:hypothetical protein